MRVATSAILRRRRVLATINASPCYGRNDVAKQNLTEVVQPKAKRVEEKMQCGEKIIFPPIEVPLI
jgi:hypothetical protein